MFVETKPQTMKGLKKFKMSMPEPNKDGVIKIFDTTIEYQKLYDKNDFYKQSVYAFESCIISLRLWDIFIKYKELKKSQETK
jgi:hypothetical protein